MGRRLDPFPPGNRIRRVKQFFFKRHDHTFQVITELLERVTVNNLTSEDKSPNPAPNYVTSSKIADFDDNSF